MVSAGSVNTPQLLMLSGVEQVEHHIATGSIVFTLEQPVSLVQSRFENVPVIQRYTMFDLVPLITLGGIEGLACWGNIKYANHSDD